MNDTLKNVYRLLNARYIINQVAYDLSLTEDIGLNTPLTHKINMNSSVKESKPPTAGVFIILYALHGKKKETYSTVANN